MAVIEIDNTTALMSRPEGHSRSLASAWGLGFVSTIFNGTCYPALILLTQDYK